MKTRQVIILIHEDNAGIIPYLGGNNTDTLLDNILVSW